MGSNIKLSCKAKGHIKWFHKPSKFSLAVNQFSSELTVQVSDAQYSNTGYYYCYGNNKQGKNILAKIYVYIYGKITFSKRVK